LVEQLPFKQLVPGSSPGGRTRTKWVPDRRKQIYLLSSGREHRSDALSADKAARWCLARDERRRVERRRRVLLGGPWQTNRTD